MYIFWKKNQNIKKRRFAMKKSKIWMVTTVIAIIVAIVLGYNFLNQKKAYATTKENDYNMAFYQIVEYVQNVKT